MVSLEKSGIWTSRDCLNPLSPPSLSSSWGKERLGFGQAIVYDVKWYPKMADPDDRSSCPQKRLWGWSQCIWRDHCFETKEIGDQAIVSPSDASNLMFLCILRAEWSAWDKPQIRMDSLRVSEILLLHCTKRVTTINGEVSSRNNPKSIWNMQESDELGSA